MRLFVEQMMLKSPRVWLTSIATKTTAWASWCSFNERCLSEDHICKLLYKITVFHEFIKQSLFWNGWGVVPISAAQNRHLFELEEGGKQPKAHDRGFVVVVFWLFGWGGFICLVWFFFTVVVFPFYDSFVLVHSKLNGFKKKNSEIWASKWISALTWAN